MLNTLWLLMLVAAVVCGALTGQLDQVAKASTDSANAAVTLALGLVGVMTFWLGLMRILHDGGLLRGIARGLRPVMVWLFPDVPPEHPAMSMMVLNMTSNILGLGNAATPFGLKAMLELDELNEHKGSASNAMALFLAINTSGLAVLPTGMIALRASLGAKAPGSIFLTTVVATLAAAIAGIAAAKLLAPLALFRARPMAAGAAAAAAAAKVDLAAAEAQVHSAPIVVSRQRRIWGWAMVAAVVAAMGVALARLASGPGPDPTVPLGLAGALKNALGTWPLIGLIVAFVLFGFLRGVKIYDALVEGGKEGFSVALRIIPYLVAILTVVGMLRASGAVDLLVTALDPVTRLLGMPAEALPMALLRPLTGSGAYAVAADIMKAHGPDSLVGEIVSTIMGSTETTFYVLALYLGVVGARNARHAVAACLVADVVGMLVAVWSCRLFLH